MASSSCSSSSEPVMLKDLLQQEAKSSTCLQPCLERSQTTVRNLLEIDLRAGQAEAGPVLQRSRSRTASAAISKLHKASEALISAMKVLHLASLASKARPPSSSGRSKRKPESTHGESPIVVNIRDIMRWKSFNEAKLVVDCKTRTTNGRSRSISSVSYGSMETESSLKLARSPDSWSPELSSSGKSKRVGEDASTNYGTPEVIGGRRATNSTYDDEKQQLSPVSVLDFQDEDGHSTSSSSRHSLPSIDRSCRFAGVAELDPVDLRQRIGLSDDDTSSDRNLHEENSQVAVEEKAKELLELLKQTWSDTHKPTVKKLLLDFFQEGLTRCNGAVASADEELVETAREWAEGGEEMETWWVEENLEAHVREMEEDVQRSKAAAEEVVVVEVEGGVLRWLVEELVVELIFR